VLFFSHNSLQVTLAVLLSVDSYPKAHPKDFVKIRSHLIQYLKLGVCLPVDSDIIQSSDAVSDLDIILDSHLIIIITP